jgi:phospholipid/cholesterol/gamma-HCH transport system substrate-binding protein
MSRLHLRLRDGIALAVVVLIVAGIVWIALPGQRTITVTAEFSEAPGLFVGNHVDILGIPVGRGVAVRMAVDSDHPVPADAQAILMAPDVVNDRYVQLDPAYTHGAKLTGGAVIPTSRTGLPVSVDQVFDSLDQLAKALGPSGANKHGALSSLLHELARSFSGGYGTSLHQAIVSASAALNGVASNPKKLAALLTNLGQLTRAAANDTQSYTAFAGDLQSVSASLASDNTDIASALSGLQTLFSNLDRFVKANRSALGGTVANLSTFATRLAAEQKQLAAAFDVGPLALENLNNAVDPNAPGGPALKGRLDPSTTSSQLVASVCGNPLLRGLTVATNPAQRTEFDVDCLFGSALDSLPTPPGASGPNVSLSALLGSK